MWEKASWKKFLVCSPSFYFDEKLNIFITSTSIERKCSFWKIINEIIFYWSPSLNRGSFINCRLVHQIFKKCRLPNEIPINKVLIGWITMSKGSSHLHLKILKYYWLNELKMSQIHDNFYCMKVFKFLMDHEWIVLLIEL